MPEQPEPKGSLGDLWRILAANRPGFIGFWLSMLQLAAHGCWIWLASNGPLGEDGKPAWESWRTGTVEALVITGAVLTAVSLAFCMYGAIHRRPKVIALIGLAISFFVGVLTAFILVLSSLSR